MNKGILIKQETTINGKVHKMSDKQIAKLENFLLSDDLHWFWQEVDMSDNNERMKFQLGKLCDAIKENMENIKGLERTKWYKVWEYIDKLCNAIKEVK